MADFQYGFLQQVRQSYRFIRKFENTAVQGTPSTCDVTAIPARADGFIATVFGTPTLFQVLPSSL